MVHVIAADLVRAVGEAVGVLVVGRHQQQLRGIGGPARDHDDVAANVSVSPSRSTTTSFTDLPSAFVTSLRALEFRSSVTFGNCRAGRTPSTSASDLA